VLPLAAGEDGGRRAVDLDQEGLRGLPQGEGDVIAGRVVTGERAHVRAGEAVVQPGKADGAHLVERRDGADDEVRRGHLDGAAAARACGQPDSAALAVPVGHHAACSVERDRPDWPQGRADEEARRAEAAGRRQGTGRLEQGALAHATAQPGCPRLAHPRQEERHTPMQLELGATGAAVARRSHVDAPSEPALDRVVDLERVHARHVPVPLVVDAPGDGCADDRAVRRLERFPRVVQRRAAAGAGGERDPDEDPGGQGRRGQQPSHVSSFCGRDAFPFRPDMPSATLRRMGEAPRPPVVVDEVLADSSLVRRLAEANAPYWPVQRYFANAAELAALSDSVAGTNAAGELIVGPVFRGDWAYDRPLVEGIEPFLHNEAFVEAARTIFEGTVVRPQIVYANLSTPLPCGDPGHTDVPAFRGVDRTQYPVWLLVTMARSGLFDRWRIPIATAVSWFYEGEGGGFTYWPDGPDRPPVSRPAITNTAVVGDNDVMFHRVEQVGDGDMVWGLTLDAELTHAGGGDWLIVDGGEVKATYPFQAVRISVSWKAQVLRDEDEARLVDEHLDDLTLARVLDVFRADLDARGIGPLDVPSDPLHDAPFVARLTAAYHQSPLPPPS
jgi:hypothetical protein